MPFTMDDAEKRRIVADATEAYFRIQHDPARRWCWEQVCESAIADGDIPFIDENGSLWWCSPDDG